MFKKITFILSVAMIFGIFATDAFSAESYQFEADGFYGYTKSDNEKMNVLGLGVVACFSEVSLENTPYEYADFYDKASYFSVEGMIGNSEYDDEAEDADLDIKGFSPTLHFVFPVVPVFAEVKYEYMLRDGDYSGYDFKYTSNGIAAELGYYLMDGLAVGIKYGYEKSVMDEFWIVPETETITNVYGAGIKYVTMFSNQTGLHLAAFYTGVNSKAEDEDVEKNSVYSLEGDFYFTQKIGLGGVVDINTGDDKDYAGNTFTGRFSIFFTPNIKLGIECSTFKADDTDETEDSNSIAVMVTGRI